MTNVKHKTMKDLEYFLESVAEGVDGYAKDMDEEYISVTVKIHYYDGHVQAEICNAPKQEARHVK